jgi:hypothetical protein
LFFDRHLLQARSNSGRKHLVVIVAEALAKQLGTRLEVGHLNGLLTL